MYERKKSLKLCSKSCNNISHKAEKQMFDAKTVIGIKL